MDIYERVYSKIKPVCCPSFQEKVADNVFQYLYGGDIGIIGWPNGTYQSEDDDGYEADMSTFIIHYCPFCGKKVGISPEEYDRGYNEACREDREEE